MRDKLLLGLLALSLTVCARAQFDGPSLDGYTCLGSDVDAIFDKLDRLANCTDWSSRSPLTTACPAACNAALKEIGAECYATVLEYSYASLGTPVGPEVATAYVNAIFSACENGTPMDKGPAVDLIKASISGIPSCASADVEAALSSGCSNTDLSTSLLTGERCAPECAVALKAYGAQCEIDLTLAMVEKVEPGMSNTARPLIEGVVNTCVGTARRLLQQGSQLDEAVRAVKATLARATLVGAFA